MNSALVSVAEDNHERERGAGGQADPHAHASAQGPASDPVSDVNKYLIQDPLVAQVSTNVKEINFTYTSEEGTWVQDLLVTQASTLMNVKYINTRLIKFTYTSEEGT